MIEMAMKYEKELQDLYFKIAFEDKFKFLDASTYRQKYETAINTWNCHDFVSVKDGAVIGNIRYEINRDTQVVSGLCVVNFGKPSIVFSKDLNRALRDIFEKFKFRKLSFTCISGNPIERTYDKICEKYGGRIVGIKESDVRLIDGSYRDLKLYEIFLDAYNFCILKNKKQSSGAK